MRKPLQIHLATLPYKQMRSYPDVGDWIVNADNSPAILCAADTGNDISNAAVLLHEFVESIYCWKHGIREEDVTAFDKLFFAEQEAGKHAPDAEPGHDQRSPYRIAHLIAERFEREFVAQFGMTWDNHAENINRLFASPQAPADVPHD